MANSDPERYRAYMREYMRGYSARRRQKIIDMLGGCCSECGSADDLHAHHVDQYDKAFVLATRWHGAWGDLVEEAQKCVLLCKNCHTEHHRARHEHGTPHRYWRGCRCGPCRKANAAYSRKHRKRKASR